MIKISNLHKYYDEYHALSGVDLHVETGSIYGLVGTNGSGKTTLIRALTGVLKAEEGEIEFDGESSYENPEVKRKISLVSDDLSYLSPFTLKEMVNYYRMIYPNWDDVRYSSMVDDLKLYSKKKMGSFSKGMQKQAAFALALSTHPDYLILDEPVDGLDPIVRRIIWKYIIDDVAEGMSVLVSSHNLREMEGICDSIGILDRGQMKLESNLDDMRSSICKLQAAFSDKDAKRWDEALEEGKIGLKVLHREKHGKIEIIIFKGSEEAVKEKVAQFTPVLYDILPLSLEEIFVYELGGDRYEVSNILL